MATPPAVLTGQRSTANVAQNRRFIDLKREITNLETGDIPLVVLLSQLRRAPARDSKVQWDQDQYVPEVLTLDNSGNVASGDGSFTVAAGQGAYAAIGDIIYVPETGETLLVTNVVTDTITVTRSWGATAAAQITDAGQLLIIGNAMAEGSGSPSLRSTVEVGEYNYVQTFKWPFELSGEWMEVDENTEDDNAYQTRKALEEHLLRIEKALWFGERNEDITDPTNPRRSLGGVNSFIQTNELDLSGGAGTLTESDFLFNFLKDAFAQGSKTGVRTLFAAPTPLAAISQFGAQSVRISPEDKLFGLNITSYQSTFGRVNMVQCRRFAEFTVGEGLMFLLDLNLLALRVLRDTYKKENIQANDADKRRDMYVSKVSLELLNEEAHARGIGITG